MTMSYLTIHNHRDGFATICPHCNKQYDNPTWYKNKVDIYPTGKRGNNEFVSVLSKCPNCSEHSWAHWQKWYVEDMKEEHQSL